MTPGIILFPIPSIKYDLYFIFSFPKNTSVNIEPIGSTRITIQFGFISFNYLAVPVIVPPVEPDAIQ